MGNHKFSSSRDTIVTLFVKDIKGDIENVGENKFRIGKVNILIDNSRTVEIVDENNNRCRISGPAGRKNLANYLNDISSLVEDEDSGNNDDNLSTEYNTASTQRFITPVRSNKLANHNDITIKPVEIPPCPETDPIDEEQQKKEDVILKLSIRCNELEKENEKYKSIESELKKTSYEIENQLACVKKEKEEIENKARKSIEEKIFLEEKYKKVEKEKDETAKLIEYLNNEFRNITDNVNRLSTEKKKLNDLCITREHEIEENHIYEENLIKEKKEINNKLIEAIKVQNNAEDKLKLIVKNNDLLEEKIANLQSQYDTLKTESNKSDSQA